MSTYETLKIEKATALIIPVEDMVELVTNHLLAEGVLYLEHRKIVDYCIGEAIASVWPVRFDQALQFDHDDHYQKLRVQLQLMALELVPDTITEDYPLHTNAESPQDAILPLFFFRKETSVYLIFT